MAISDIWKKATNGAYGDAKGWSAGVVPDGDDEVTLPQYGRNYTVTTEGQQQALGLDIYAGAALDITSGPSAGFFTDFGAFINDGLVKVDAGAQFVIGNVGFGAQGYANDGVIELAGGTMDVLDSNVLFSGGGEILLTDNIHNKITCGSGETTLELGNQTLLGAGVIAGDDLFFVVSRAGVVDASDTNALTIMTGPQTVNAGLMESTNVGGLQIIGQIDNDGVLASRAGLLDVTGNVDGFGDLRISGAGEIELGGQAYQDVTFAAGSTGALILDHSSLYTVNEIYGARKGAHIDLRDILYNANVTPTFSLAGSHDEYTLVVTEGKLSADLYLMGGINTYDKHSFVLGTDHAGGTMVTVV